MFPSEHALWFTLIGALLVSVGVLGPLLSRTWLAPSHVQLLGGIIAGPLVLQLIELDWRRHAILLELMSEVAVIVSLYAAGIKLRIPLRSGRWLAPIILATLTMLVTIALAAGVGIGLLGLSIPAAILLGAVLAPTDPVLAEKIQVENVEDDDRLRQSITGEAGINDGSAFPFVLLAVGLSDRSLHDLGPNLSTWFLVDVLWKISGGLLLGAVAGYLLGKAAVAIRQRYHDDSAEDVLLAIGLIAVVYGVALTANTYAFLAVFAAAVSLRRVELLGNKTVAQAGTGSDDVEPEENPTACDAKSMVGEQSEIASVLERIVQVFLVVVVGVLLCSQDLRDWRYWVFGALMILVLRPLAVMTTLRVPTVTAHQRRLIAWFGVRGIGTVYYLAHAIGLGAGESLEDELALVTGCCVATITLSLFGHGLSDTPLMRRYAATLNAARSDTAGTSVASERDRGLSRG